MKKMIYFFPLILTGFIGMAQPGTDQVDPKPIVTFETEVIDYGTIEQNSDGIREFHFVNTGKAPLIISTVQSTCGCTAPSYPKEPISPGKSGVIKVKYDTKRLGAINKSVTVISNAERPSIVLRIKGAVITQAISPEKEDAIMQAD